MRLHIAALAITAPLLIVNCAAPGQALDPDMILSSEAPAGERPSVADEEWVVRHALADVNPQAFAREGVSAGDTLRARLFDDELIQLRLVAMESVADFLNVRLEMISPEAGFVLLSLGDGRVLGTIEWQSRGKKLYVRHDAELNRHVLLEVDPALEGELPGAPPEIQP